MRADEVFKDMSDVDELREELDKREMTIRLMDKRIDQLTEENEKLKEDLKRYLKEDLKRCINLMILQNKILDEYLKKKLEDVDSD